MQKSRPSLSEEDLRGLSSAQSFERGKDYYNDGAVFDTRKVGDELRGYCHGSSNPPYLVSARLGPNGVVDVHCTCPYDWGGICKHIVALLLTWVNEPEMFQASAPVDDRLAGKSKEDLITLIQEMLKREPELERLLDLPFNPVPGSPLDLSAFRRQIDFILQKRFSDPQEQAYELAALVETADRLSAEENWLAAGAIYHLILSEIVPDYDEFYDEDGDISSVLQKCAQGLEVSFTEGIPDRATRKSWFEALLEAEFKDIEMGGIDLAYPAQDILVEHPTDEEWREIEARIREKIGSMKDRYSRWGREALVNLLARRLESAEREEEISDLIFDLGSEEQQAFELLRQGRYAEAVAVAEKHFVDLPGLVLQFADALVQSGGITEAVAYVTGQLETRSRISYLPWLAQVAEKQQDHPTALRWWQDLFRESPNLKNYQNLKGVANQIEQWDSLRRNLIHELESKAHWDLSIEIALEEGDVIRALELLPRQRWSRHELKVAHAAETEHPEASIEIYCQAVDQLIAARGRGNYQEAASILQRVKTLSERLGTKGNWERYFTGLRAQYSRLPALQDELKRAGL
jgi:uncharacterized Zn finger protein